MKNDICNQMNRIASLFQLSEGIVIIVVWITSMAFWLPLNFKLNQTKYSKLNPKWLVNDQWSSLWFYLQINFRLYHVMTNAKINTIYQNNWIWLYAKFTLMDPSGFSWPLYSFSHSLFRKYCVSISNWNIWFVFRWNSWCEM